MQHKKKHFIFDQNTSITIKNNEPSTYILKICKKTEQDFVKQKNQRWPHEANSPQIKFGSST